MKRRDYEIAIGVEVSNAGSVSDFGRGMEVGAISMLKHIISIDRDLDEEERSYLLDMAEKSKMHIVDISWRKAVNESRR